MDIDAFILIGGRSSRLGTDKAFVQLGGRTLATRAAETIEQALPNSNIRFVVGEDQQFRGDLIFKLGHPVVADLKPGFGAWSGLHAALSYAETEWLFVFACDLPFVSSEFLILLAGCLREQVDAVVPQQTDGRLQPLCAFYRRKAALEQIDSFFSGKKLLPPLSSIFDKLRTQILEPEHISRLSNHERLFLNINTEQEFADAMSSTVLR